VMNGLFPVLVIVWAMIAIMRVVMGRFSGM
jgi:hypothetical protein